MQTYIENILTVVRNISGIDEAVYSNIYDIELTDKTVFVIIPGDITDNFTAYLVNGSILLMSKVMLVLKSKYIETNMVITSKDNIKEFSLDNCSGVYNVIKFKLIYRREDCGDSYEGMFVKSINGFHGEVFLDIPEKVSDLILDIDYATEEYVNEKISEIEEGLVKSVNGQKGDVLLDIPEKVSDLVQDVNYITEEYADEKYMQKGDVPTDVYTKSEIDGKFVDSSKYTDDTYAKKSSLDNFYTKSDIDGKVSAIDSSISDVSARLKTVKETINGLDNVYVKSETYNIDKNAQAEVNQDVTTKLGKINTSIGTLNSSVNAIENAGYATETWVSGQGYLNADDKTELEGKINDKQDAGDYATNTRVNEVEGKIPEVKDFVTNSSISTNYYNKTEIDNKGYLNKVSADGYYQEKGNYVNETVYSNKVSEIDSSISDVSARLKTANDNIANKADLSELANYYTTTQGTALEGRVSTTELNITGILSEIQTLDSKIPTDYVSNSSISTNYYMKKDVYNKEETDGFIGGLRTEISNTYELKGHYDSAISTLNSSVNTLETNILTKQDTLVSGTNIKTINGNSILGNGNIEAKGEEHVSLTYAEWEALPYDEKMADKVYLIKDAENVYQEPLVSGTNIKTINGNSILGSGNIEIQGGGGGGTSEHQNITQAEYDALTPEQKQADIVYFITDADVVYATQEQVQEVGNSVNTLSGRVETAETEINNIKNAGYATLTWVSSQGYLTEHLSLAGYATENYVNNKISELNIDDYLKIADLPDYSVKFTEIDSSISDVSTKVNNSLSLISDLNTRVTNNSLKNVNQDSSIRTINSSVNAIESANYATLTWVSSQGYLNTADKTELEGKINGKQDAGDYALKSEIPDVTGFATKTEVSAKQDTLVSGTNIKTINGNSILGSGNIEIKSGGLEYLTPGTIVRTEGGMKLEFIADLTRTEANRVKAIQINSGEQYYYELISGNGHIISTSTGADGAYLNTSKIFTWNYDSINTRDGYDDENGYYSDIWPLRGDNVGKLYRYLGQEETQEISLSDYIDSKIDSKIGNINTILESI